jgi:uncharacterized protein (DUF1684 family)
VVIGKQRRFTPRSIHWVALLTAITLVACSKPPVEAPAPPMTLATAADIEAARRQRDDAFKNAPDSPIPNDKKAAFAGLTYYPFNPGLQFKVKLTRLPDPEPLRMITTDGVERPAVRLGQISFAWQGTEQHLTVYQLRDQSAEYWTNLFLPFKDATSGRDTYGAGRYLDLGEGENDWFVLDFNLAYHPACAYGGTGFECPVTPEENRLPFPVEAGERLGSASH